MPWGLCRGGAQTWEHFFPVSLVPTGSCTPQFAQTVREHRPIPVPPHSTAPRAQGSVAQRYRGCCGVAGVPSDRMPLESLWLYTENFFMKHPHVCPAQSSLAPWFNRCGSTLASAAKVLLNRSCNGSDGWARRVGRPSHYTTLDLKWCYKSQLSHVSICSTANLQPGQTTCENHRITESQNHRMVRVGRDLCGSSSPTLLPKQGHLQ